MYDDQPPFGVDDKCRAAFFGKHPLSRSVLGTAASVGGLSAAADAAIFRAAIQSAKYCRWSGSGRIDFARLCDTAEECCGSWPTVEAARPLPAAKPNAGFHVVCKETAAQEYAIMMSPGPTAADADRYAAKILATVLGDDSGSRLVLGIGRSGLGGALQPASPRIFERRHVFDVHELRSRIRGRQFDAGCGSLSRQRWPRELPRRSWTRRRTKSTPGWCWRANGPGAGCLPWARIGYSGGNTAACGTIWMPSRRLRLRMWPRCSRNIR